MYIITYLDLLNAITLHVTSRYKYGFQRSETKVVVRLVRQLFVTQPAENIILSITKSMYI